MPPSVPLVGTPTEEEIHRFLIKQRLNPITGCYVWTAAKKLGYATKTNPNPWYGVFRWQGRCVQAQRFALFIEFGCDPGPSVDHLCHNTLCVNPDHLRGGSIQENNRNRRCILSDYCTNGHLRTYGPGGSVYVTKTGKRDCRDCAAVRDKQRYPDKYAKEKEKNTHSSEMRDFAHHPKLDWEKVREIRKLSSEGMSQRALARQFMVSQPMIGLIVRNETWKD